MTTQRPDTHDPVGSRARRADAGSVRVSAGDIELLQIVGEQYAVTLPQLARLMACSDTRHAGFTAVGSRLGPRSCAVRRRTGTRVAHARGTSLAGIDYALWRANPGMLGHIPPSRTCARTCAS